MLRGALPEAKILVPGILRSFHTLSINGMFCSYTYFQVIDIRHKSHAAGAGISFPSGISFVLSRSDYQPRHIAERDVRAMLHNVPRKAAFDECHHRHQVVA
jgi:hypothetical protein